MFRSSLWIIVCFLELTNLNVSAQPTLNLLKINNDYYCALTNDTEDSGIYWGNQDKESRSTTTFCNIKNNSSCYLDTQSGWSWQEDTDFPLILDHRWEGMMSTEISFAKPVAVFQPQKDDFRISFSFKGKEVHIFLCDKEYEEKPPRYSKCYWIGIDANNGTKSYLRKCEEGQIPTKMGNYASKCSDSGTSSEHTALLHKSKWNHFIVSKKNNYITVWHHGRSKNILEFQDNDVPYKVNYVIVRTEGKDVGYMKVHKVNSLYSKEKRSTRIALSTNTTPFCVSLYARICSHCSLRAWISNANSSNIQEQTVATTSEDWQRIILKSESNQKIARISVRAELNNTEANNSFWYISSTIQNCDEQAIPKKKGKPTGCCFVLKYPELKICSTNLKDYKMDDTDFECRSDTIGRNCLPYTPFGTTQYTNSKLCYTLPGNQISCSCGAGYSQSSDCLQTCSPGTYGHNCKRQCGKCINICNRTDGRCECKENFDGETCHKPILPIVNKAPTVIKTENRRIIIKLNLENDGQEEAQYYQVQYKEEQDNHWVNSKSQIHLVTGANHDIEGLKPSTHYAVRVLLYTSAKRAYDGEYVPELRTETTCSDPDQKYLVQNVTDTSIRVAFINTDEEICQPLSQFKLCLSKTLKRQRECRVLQYTATFTDLGFYENYTIELENASNIISTWTIQTDEGPPEKVQAIYVGKTTNTSVVLTWNDPQKRNGKIRGYRIKYFRTGSLACTSKSAESEENEVNATRNDIRIDSLAPYSAYTATIWAFTKYEGGGEVFKFETNPTNNPTEQEFPKLSYSHSNKLYVTLHWNCSILAGPVTFYIVLTCQSSWCRNTTERSQNIFHVESKTLSFSVIGYTNYTLTKYLSRNIAQISEVDSFRTPPTAPEVVRNIIVYTRNTTSVGLRWLPPYPPTGEIEYYAIRYDRTYKHVIVSKTSECKIWSEQICHVLTVSSSTVYISIWAKNIDVVQNGTVSDQIFIEAKEEVSEAPKNLSLKWDEEYNLTVQWEHPDRTNGQLLQFLVFVDNQLLTSYNIADEKLTYEQKLNIENTNLTLKQLNVEVKAKNSAGNSNSIKMLIDSPPKQPKLATGLRTEDVTNNTFKIVIPEILDVEGDISNMYIIISDTSNNQIIEREMQHFENRLIKKINVSTEYSWIAGEFNLHSVTNREGFSFKVGDDTESFSKTDGKWKLKNRKLNTGRTYKVLIVLSNMYKQFNRSRTYIIEETTTPPKPPEGLEYLLILLLIPIILCVLCVLFIRRNREKVTSSIYVSLQQLGLSRNTSDVPLRPLIRENNTPTPQNSVAKSIAVASKKTEEPVMAEEVQYSKPVKITDLNQYIKESIENGEFERQHGVFQRGQTKPWDHGAKQQNKSKNRYTNLAAYDHTRVKLEIINKDPYSDYINANYIDGYKSRKAYIATQGPKPSTLNDFWRMIWQEKVEYIIMIANIVEAGKKKVEKYWPEINESKEFNNINVNYVSVDVMANFEVRYFNVSCDGQERKIQQLHFLTWPDHGVPLYAQSLSPFLKKMLTIPHGKVPVVVHCSAGVGRTGSLILSDICLRMAAREGKIDAFYYLHKIRDQRVNMVDNVEQYKLVHLVLLQCLVAPDTGILCNESMEKNIEIVTSTKIEEEMNYLDESAWQDEAMRTTSFNTDLPIIHNKNRFKNILPDPASRVCLSPYPTSDPSSSYINAVSVDAFTVPSKFIVTQNPLSSTVGDFWRLIEEKEITMIICLNDLDLQEKTTCKFYPTSNGLSMKPVPYLEIKCNRKEVNAHFKVYSITMSRLDCKDEDVHINILHLTNWNSNALHPENPIGLLMAYEEMNRLGRTSDTIAITCHNGATACGLYVAMCFVIDKIKMEQICDVCLAVRTVRHGRKEFVRNPEQYTFLYDCALEYVRQFSMYSNFSSGKTSQ